MKIVLKKLNTGCKFDIVAANSKVVATSQIYANRRNALETAEQVAGKLKIVEAA